MNELTKIKDVSSKYNITTRTLRYYEDMGLITSTRNDDYAYRMYDENAVKRIAQILILRKLNIRIKDIKRIFAASDSVVVLDVLNQKADDIDSEVALLHELKEIVLDFVQQIEQADFHNSEQVKMLYDKAREIKVQMTTPDYVGNSQATLTSANRLVEVTEKLEDKRITLPTIIKTYKQDISAMRFIGKKYESGASAWNDFDGELLKVKLGIKHKDVNEDGDSIIGLMSHRAGFEYWLGFFMPEGTAVPEGFEYEDFPEAVVGTAWVYLCEEGDGIEPMAFEKLQTDGFEPIDDWWFERYHPMRSSTDKNGYAILDLCWFLK